MVADIKYCQLNCMCYDIIFFFCLICSTCLKLCKSRVPKKISCVIITNVISAHARGIEHDVIVVAFMYEPHPVVVVTVTIELGAQFTDATFPRKLIQ